MIKKKKMKRVASTKGTKRAVPILTAVKSTLDDKPKYPDWQLLPLADKGSPLNEMYFRWMFDKIGYRENTPESPYGIQWAIRLVSKKFAMQAVEVFSGDITILTEDELEEFWNTKITAHLPDQLHDHNELVALNARLNIMKNLGEDQTEVRDRIERALDPDNSALGVRKHPFKAWKDFKKNNHIQILSV